MISKKIRALYLDFFRSKGHAIIPSASLIPENDPTTLFTSSGMQPLVPYLLGERHPRGIRLVDSQKSFRSGDIDEVGDNRHNTFFEMLGNWSLGDYFKKEQLPWFWDFLTKELGLDPKRLYATVYQGNQEIGVQRDDASTTIWKELYSKVGIKAKALANAEQAGMRDGRIFYYGDSKNWWSRSGEPKNMPIGEIGGPDSEVFYDLGADLMRHEKSRWKDRPCHVNCDCGRFIELGNNVFIEFVRTKEGFEQLKQKNVDFGGGLERITMVMQGKDNVFETDLFKNALDKISELSAGKKYRGYMKEFEIIADHLKAATFIMGDDKGVVPSNVDQGYVVRRLVRRALRYGAQIGIKDEAWTHNIAETVIRDYAEIYPELKRNKEFILRNLKEEEKKFARTLRNGLNEFKKMSKNKKISGQQAFILFSTYGFPFEITEELAHEEGTDISREEFDQEFKKHQELSRSGSEQKFKGGLADASEATSKLHTATHLLQAGLKKVLNSEVQQRGSNITAERLRFDFAYSEKMTRDQIKEVEKLVNQWIADDIPVRREEMSYEEAKARQAVGLFADKYGDKVKVYTIDGVSCEICGGPHAKRTGELGHFKIKKEESSSAGVRRIKAVLE